MKKVLCFLLLFPILACDKKNKPEEPSPLNVILISIDTLRADYLKLYSDHGVVTPNIEALARTGVVFDNAIAQVPYTLPSHCTLFTGNYPSSHGVRDNVRDVLPESMPTLAGLFRNAGYQTAGFAGSMVLSRQTGLGRGFDHYDDTFSRADVHGEDLGAIERPAEDVLASFQDWFSKRNRAQNFFAFLHFYDPHSPYAPPAAFDSGSGDMKELYRGEIRYVDSVLGELFATLKNETVWDNTVIVLTSDHGEMLLDHAEFGHGFFVYQQALHVPFILRDPGNKQGIRIRDVVQLADVAPTLLQAAEIANPPEMHGESLIPLLSGSAKKNRFAFSESYFASLQFGVSPLFAVQDARYKFIDAPRPEMFDLPADPFESRNLYESQRPFAEKLRQTLIQHRQSTGNVKQQQRAVSPEEAEQFAALGYLGGAVPEKEWDYKSDPKDFIDEWNSSLEVTLLMSRNEFGKALSIIRKLQRTAKTTSSSLKVLESKCLTALGDVPKAGKILTEMGDTPEALSALAELYSLTGKTAPADQAYKKCLDKQFSFFVLYNYVLYLRNTGRTQQALDVVNAARFSQPDTDQARSFFAETYFLLEDLNTAERLCMKLVEQRPWELKWYLQLSAIYQKRGEVQRALSLMAANKNRFNRKPEFFLRLGILYKLAQDSTGEIASFREYLRLDSRDSRGYFYLAKALLDQRQDLEVVFDLTQRGLKLEPDRSMQIFAHYILAEAFEATGKKEESQREAKMAERLEKM